jgi:hypothetical protein
VAFSVDAFVIRSYRRLATYVKLSLAQRLREEIFRKILSVDKQFRIMEIIINFKDFMLIKTDFIGNYSFTSHPR